MPTFPGPVPVCPVCGGVMQVVYERYGQTVAACVDCHSGLTIPESAYDVMNRKRGGKPSVS